ncbi:MAG: hypothetical protein ACRELT_13485, partial [Longimicrobiales bacterium]
LYAPDAVASMADATALPASPAGTDRPADGASAAPYFQRRFLPGETREIRLYMLGGDDLVRVTGQSRNSIRVRVMGGGGDDTLVDSSAVTGGGWATRFYTAHGNDIVRRGPNTRIDLREFADLLPGRPLDMVEKAPDPDEAGDVAASEEAAEEEGEGEADDEAVGLDEDVADRLQRSSYRDWGRTSSISPAADFRSGAGLLIGIGTDYVRYGFRREEYKYRLHAKALYSLDNSGFGLELFGDYHPENTRLGVSLSAGATQYETFRFFGYGNDTEPIDGVSPRVHRDEVIVRPQVYRSDAVTYFGVGPVFRLTDLNYDDGSPIDLLQPGGADAFAQAGAAAELRHERGVTSGSDPRGFSFSAWGAAYPALLDVSEPFGRTRAVARAWIPLGWPFLALRAGADRAWGEFPVHEAVFLGGRSSLRG